MQQSDHATGEPSSPVASGSSSSAFDQQRPDSRTRALSEDHAPGVVSDEAAAPWCAQADGTP